MRGGETDPTLILFRDEAQFRLSGYVDCRNNTHCYAKSPILIDEVTLHYVKLLVWCAMCASSKTGPFSSEKI